MRFSSLRNFCSALKRGASNIQSPEKPKNKNNKKIYYAVIAAIIAIILLLILSSSITAYLFFPQAPGALATKQALANDENMLFSYEINRYPANAEISNASGENITMGFALDPGNINFGIVPRGGNIGKRFITLDNTADEPSKITLVAYGNIAPMVKFSENDFLLWKGAPKPVEIILETENGTALGNYTGEIDIIVKKPKYSIAAKLL